jgi:hypothetical protein
MHYTVEGTGNGLPSGNPSGNTVEIHAQTALDIDLTAYATNWAIHSDRVVATFSDYGFGQPRQGEQKAYAHRRIHRFPFTQ